MWATVLMVALNYLTAPVPKLTLPLNYRRYCRHYFAGVRRNMFRSWRAWELQNCGTLVTFMVMGSGKNCNHFVYPVDLY